MEGSLRRLAGFLCAALLVIIIFWIAARGISGSGGDLVIVYTNNQRGNILASTANLVPPEFRIASFLEGCSFALRLRREEEAKGNTVLFLAGGNALLGADLMSNWLKGEPCASVLARARCDVFSPGEEELRLGRSLPDLCASSGLPVVMGNLVSPPLPKGCSKDRAFRWGRTAVVVTTHFSPPAKRRTELPFSFASGAAPGSAPGPFRILMASSDEYDDLAGGDPDLIIPCRLSARDELPQAPQGSTELPQAQCRRVGRTWIAPFVDSRRSVGILRVKRALLGHRISWSACPLAEEPMEAPDSSLEDAARGYRERFESIFGPGGQKLWESFLALGSDDMGHDDLRYEESAVGDLVTDWVAAYTGADVVLLNHHALRAPMRGILSLRDTLFIAPYGNRLVVLDMAGRDLRALLKRNLNHDRRFLQFSGAKMSTAAASVSTESMGRDVGMAGPGFVEITVAGAPLDDGKRYRLVAPDYLAAGAKGKEPIFRECRTKVDTGVLLNAVVYDGLIDNPWLQAPGRRMAPSVKPGSAAERASVPKARPGREFSAALLEGLSMFRRGNLDECRRLWKRAAALSPEDEKLRRLLLQVDEIIRDRTRSSRIRPKDSSFPSR
jgi:hypothetical protein